MRGAVNVKLFNLMWQRIFNQIMGNSESDIEQNIEPLKVYKVSLNTSGDYQKVNSEKPSAILKRCEGAHGILYLHEDKQHPLLPHSVFKRTRIIEIKDVSMKVRIHKHKVINQIIHIENVLGFLKEID